MKISLFDKIMVYAAYIMLSATDKKYTRNTISTKKYLITGKHKSIKEI